MNRVYIRSVMAEDNHVLRVEFVTGSILMLDMSKRLDSIRLKPLKDPEVWKDAKTNGIYVRWKDTELSYDEILSMACEGPPS